MTETTATEAPVETAPPSAEQLAADEQLESRTPRIFGELATTPPPAAPEQDIEFVLDIPVQVTVELGRTKLPIRKVLQLAQGSVVELNNLAGEPMDVLVNGCLVAQGEVVVVDDRFGIRLTDIIAPTERVRKLQR